MSAKVFGSLMLCHWVRGVGAWQRDTVPVSSGSSSPRRRESSAQLLREPHISQTFGIQYLTEVSGQLLTSATLPPPPPKGKEPLVPRELSGSQRQFGHFVGEETHFLLKSGIEPQIVQLVHVFVLCRMMICYRNWNKSAQ